MKKIACVMKFTIVLLVATTTVAHAYSDPGSGLMALQLIASALVGMLFYFTKIKNLIVSKLRTKKNDKE